MAQQIYTFAERPELASKADHVQAGAWPEFMLHDTVANRHWRKLMTMFPEFQFMLVAENDDIVAVGNSIPVIWKGDLNALPPNGWDAMLEQGVRIFEQGHQPTTLCGLGVSIAHSHRGQGISGIMISAMKDIAIRHDFNALIAPVRPTSKSRYPLTPIERYIQWTQPDGAPFDPWLRTHWRLGAEVVRPCLESMRIIGTVAEWEAWTEMRFPESGLYILPEALVPVEIDCEQNTGRYVEPNVWMRHPIR